MEIANAFAKYFHQLYLKGDLDNPQPTTACINDFLNKLSLPVLDLETSLSLNLPWSLDEVEKAKDSLQSDKGPLG